MRKTWIFPALLVGLVATSQAFAGLRILPKAVPVSGTGMTLATEFVGNDEVVVTVKPENLAEVAHYGIVVGFNPTEYEFVEVRGASVSRAENGRVTIADSYTFSRDPDAVGIVLRKTGLDWGRIEPQGLDVITKDWERRIYDPAPVFTPNPEGVFPKELALFQNYPNPFNPSTEIRFSVASEGPVELAVYNMVGQRVRTLVADTLPAGEHTVQWDATDNAGQQVSAGMYFYRLQSDGQTAVRKMILAK